MMLKVSRYALAFTVLAAMLAPVTVSAQDSDGGGGADFGIGATFGVSSFEDPATGQVNTYQLLALRPDLALGNFGIGLNLALNYRFTGGDGNDFEIRREDWVPSDQINFLELYLPKFRYIRYGTKGDDLFVRFGSFSDATLGNGFLVSNYSNELYMPERRIFGANFDLDGELFGFPYLGIETLVANVAAFDVIAARLYTRPFAWLEIPILPNMQLGGTFAADTAPFYHARKDPNSVYSSAYEPAASRQSVPGDALVTAWGIDVRQPIIGTSILSLATFADFAAQDESVGGMIGAGGRLLGVVNYGAQIRFLGNGFVPGYFDTTYDRRRIDLYQIYNGQTTREGSVGWFGRLGFAFFDDGVVFDATVSGPFGGANTGLPSLSGRFLIAEGMVPGFAGLSVEASYEKFNIDSWGALVSAEDAIIGARFNIRSGPVVISLVYDLVYDPFSTAAEPWTITSSLESTISF